MQSTNSKRRRWPSANNPDEHKHAGCPHHENPAKKKRLPRFARSDCAAFKHEKSPALPSLSWCHGDGSLRRRRRRPSSGCGGRRSPRPATEETRKQIRKQSGRYQKTRDEIRKQNRKPDSRNQENTTQKNQKTRRTISENTTGNIRKQGGGISENRTNEKQKWTG